LPKSNLIKVLECDIDKLDTIDVSQLTIKRLNEDDHTYKTNHTNHNHCIDMHCSDYDVFYHFAWGNTDKNTRNDPVLQQKNIKYALDAVNLAKKLGCKKYIGAGSQAEYGRVEGKLNASIPINPDIAYGMAKYAAGRLTNLRCKELNIEHIWVRILSVYGIYDGPNTMISYAIKELLAGKEPEFTKCEQKWDYLFSEDAGRAFYFIGDRGKANKTYCLGSGIPRPLADYVKTINKLLKKSENIGIGKTDYITNQV
jgi:nucleoside-diphosphate-sugar epimerase